jgi:DNA-nicking Smr family endonuclease
MSRKPDNDRDLFHRTLADAKPLKRGAARIARPDTTSAKPAAERKAPLAEPPPKRARPRAPQIAAPQIAAPQSDAPLERRTDKKLRRGQLEIDAKLDLHGMILRDAEPALSHFLAQAQERGHRAVLVVTGKGTKIDPDTGRIQEGAIRRELAHWLGAAKNRARIIGYRAAHARHGGGGAFYVLIRRVR